MVDLYEVELDNGEVVGVLALSEDAVRERYTPEYLARFCGATSVLSIHRVED